jgi:hypothetical protein
MVVSRTNSILNSAISEYGLDVKSKNGGKKITNDTKVASVVSQLQEIVKGSKDVNQVRGIRSKLTDLKDSMGDSKQSTKVQSVIARANKTIGKLSGDAYSDKNTGRTPKLKANTSSGLDLSKVNFGSLKSLEGVQNVKVPRIDLKGIDLTKVDFTPFKSLAGLKVGSASVDSVNISPVSVVPKRTESQQEVIDAVNTWSNEYDWGEKSVKPNWSNDPARDLGNWGHRDVFLQERILGCLENGGRSLSFHEAMLSSLPDVFGSSEFARLDHLDLTYNNLESIPSSILQLPSTCTIHLKNTSGLSEDAMEPFITASEQPGYSGPKFEYERPEVLATRDPTKPVTYTISSNWTN